MNVATTPPPSVEDDQVHQDQAGPPGGLSSSPDELRRIEPARGSAHARILAPYLRRPDLAAEVLDLADPLYYVSARTLRDLLELQGLEVLKLRQEGHSVGALMFLEVEADPPPCAVCSRPIGLHRVLFCSDACKQRIERRRKSAALAVLDAQEEAHAYALEAARIREVQAESAAYGARDEVRRLRQEVEELRTTICHLSSIHQEPQEVPAHVHDLHPRTDSGPAALVAAGR